MFFKFRIIFILCFIFYFQNGIYGQAHPDFYVLTIPKSGTHLMIKLLKILINKDYRHPWVPVGPYNFPGDSRQTMVSDSQFEAAMLQYKNTGTYPLSHTNMTELYQKFNVKHPEYVRFIVVRDLRDALVSCVFYLWNQLERELGPTTFDQKLTFLINMKHTKTKNALLNIYRNAELAMKCLKDPCLIWLRYEELVGEKGGGNRELQEKSIVKVANALGICLTQPKLDDIVEVLFGNCSGPQIPTNTFREGKIGDWKRYFKLKHIMDFNKKWGKFQLALGYSTDSSKIAK